MRDKFRVFALIFVAIASVLLVIGCASRWYFINSSDTVDAVEIRYSFYGPKVVVKTYGPMNSEDSVSYSDLALDSTHNYFNGCLAMCAIAFILGVVSVVMIALNIFNILPDITWTISRILILLLIVFNFIGVVISAGYPAGFKKDEFEPCLNTCQDKFRGSFEGNATKLIKWGPGAGFYLCVVALFPGVGAVATSIVSFIIGKKNGETSQ